MKKLLFALLFIPLAFACNDNGSLTITNDAGENFRITHIDVKYRPRGNDLSFHSGLSEMSVNFKDLNIQNGQSETFTFSDIYKDMQGQEDKLEGINTNLPQTTNIIITYICASQSYTRSYPAGFNYMSVNLLGSTISSSFYNTTPTYNTSPTIGTCDTVNLGNSEIWTLRSWFKKILR
ncbi:hypothetical protein N8376_02120 [Flavobacteriaceae bacterium]|nr:hypothetical protein [Flavobacteriaceae bacterium]